TCGLGNSSRSSTTQRTPAFARYAAIAPPAGPPPMMPTSKSKSATWILCRRSVGRQRLRLLRDGALPRLGIAVRRAGALVFRRLLPRHEVRVRREVAEALADDVL